MPERTLSRRTFLTRTGLLAGSGAAVALLDACGVSTPPAASASATSAGTAASTAPTAATPVQLSVEGWNYDPTFHQQRIDVFEKAYPNVKVDLIADAAAAYGQKIIARFTSGNAPDVIFVHDNQLAGWADAGYIQPVQGLPSWQEKSAGLIPFAKTGLTYKGKLWGLPYASDFLVYIYNEQILSKVQIETLPVTWSDVAQQSLEIKRAGLLETPVIFPLNATAHLHWWSAIYGSGGSLFNENDEPLFPDKDPVALQVLEWLVDAARNTKILNMGSVQMGTGEGRLAMAGGRAAFISSAEYDLKVINDPKKSKIAGAGKQILFPSLTAVGPHGTAGFSTMYCISAKTQHRNEAWELVQTLGSPDSGKALCLKDGVGYAFEALNSDKEIAASRGKWMDATLASKQAATAKELQALSATWYPTWSKFNQQQLQEAVLGQKTPRAALTDSANKAIALKQGK